MKRECSVKRYSALVGFLVLAIAALPIESHAKTSTACVPVYQQCVAAKACGAMEPGTDARAACFASCNTEEAQCRGQSLVPTNTAELDSLTPDQSAAPSTTPNKSK
jgi:hypothetical protein